jgi:hypothetical protein
MGRGREARHSPPIKARDAVRARCTHKERNAAGAGCGELPCGLPRKGAVCGVARACKAASLAARVRLASSPFAGQRDPSP